VLSAAVSEGCAMVELVGVSWLRRVAQELRDILNLIKKSFQWRERCALHREVRFVAKKKKKVLTQFIRFIYRRFVPTSGLGYKKLYVEQLLLLKYLDRAQFIHVAHLQSQLIKYL